MRSEADFKKWLRRIALGVAAGPLAWSSVACGRTESNELQVIPNASVIRAREMSDGGRDGGVDAGCGEAGEVIAGWECSGVTTADCVFHAFDLSHFDGGPCPQCSGLPVAGCEVAGSGQTICWQWCGVGRLTGGVRVRASGLDSFGTELANMAAHEAGAALSFSLLATELERHGIGRELTRRARRAAREEVRHARLVGSLARRHGGSFNVTSPRDTQRTLESIALENAAEGCVRETLGALIGLHQASHAADAQLRVVMREVSADELGHSAWSHALAEQLDSRLPVAARRRVREARAIALHTAARELSVSRPRGVRSALGLPDSERVQSLARALTIS